MNDNTLGELPSGFDLKIYARDYDNYTHWLDEVSAFNLAMYESLGLLKRNRHGAYITGSFTEKGKLLYKLASV